MSSSASERPSRAVPRSDNERAQRVLDAAEELFALHGYDGVTVRQIAKLAEVDVALPSYYFGAKRDLFDAVFQRRADHFNRARSEALDAVAHKWRGQSAPVAAIIKAFLQPIAEAQLQGDRGWGNYCRLVAQVNSSPVWVQMMTQHFDELVRKFIDMIAHSLPGAERSDLYWAYHFLSGSLSLSMANTGRIQSLSGGLCQSDDFETLYSRMIDIYTAGFQQLAGRQRSAEPRFHL